jgi:UrcA family protein
MQGFQVNTHHEESHMSAKVTVASARILLGAAVVCTLFAANVSAKDEIVTDSMKVSPQGLDLSQPADARKFYTRLEHAAWLVCTRGTRVGLAPVDNQFNCYQNALGAAVHTSNQPLVTQIYLATHTLQEAAAHRIAIPGQVAAK